MAFLRYQKFHDMISTYPGVGDVMRKKCYKYKDPMTRFRIQLLKQCDYFKEEYFDEEFFYKVQLHLSSTFFDAGSEIIGKNEVCDQLIFLAYGEVEILMFDVLEKKYVLETLRAGSVIGQYGIFYDQPSMFKMVASKDVKLMTLDRHFFREFKDDIDGLEFCLFIIE
jgi:CRP-like cAMP-binding protein